MIIDCNSVDTALLPRRKQPTMPASQGKGTASLAGQGGSPAKCGMGRLQASPLVSNIPWYLVKPCLNYGQWRVAAKPPDVTTPRRLFADNVMEFAAWQSDRPRRKQVIPRCLWQVGAIREGTEQSRLHESEPSASHSRNWETVADASFRACMVGRPSLV